ncbi:hypothetical protein ACQRBV_15295 [Pseudomonas sp. R11F]|nr:MULTISPECIES: hypothetical protein [Pseudomonas]
MNTGFAQAWSAPQTLLALAAKTVLCIEAGAFLTPSADFTVV